LFFIIIYTYILHLIFTRLCRDTFMVWWDI